MPTETKARAAHTPGPWTCEMLSRPQLRPWFISRNTSPRNTFTHHEQLRDGAGGIARFETEAETRAALDRATGVAA